MKTNTLKTATFALALAAAAISSVSATAVGPDSDDEIAAQIHITRNSIDQLLRQLEGRQAPATFQATDYRKWNAEFRKNVEAAVVEFEETMRTSILPKLEVWVKRSNDIYLSKEFSESQKWVLMTQVRAQIADLIKVLEPEYHAASRKVYVAAGDFKVPAYRAVPRTPTRKEQKDSLKPAYLHLTSQSLFTGEYGPTYRTLPTRLMEDGEGYLVKGGWDKKALPISSSTWITINDAIETSDHRGESAAGIHSQLRRSVFQDDTETRIRKECRSQICLGLTTGDLVFFLRLVRSELDRPIEVKLKNGYDIRLEASSIKTETVIDHLILNAYSDAIKDLPFDI